MTFQNTHSVTSSLESEDGVTPSDSQNGVMIDLFGQVHAPVKVFQSQEKEKVRVTSVTSGPSGIGSSKSVALQQSLANRLLERLGSGGLMQSQQILSLRTTPSLRQYCQDSLKAPITNGNGSGSWPTPQTMDGARCNQIRSQEELKEARKNGGCSNLRESVHTWPTPCSSDHRYRGDWECPVTQRRVKIGKSIELTMLVGSVVPTGKQLSGSNVKTEKRVRYRLNPMFSLWLMGYPRFWIQRAIPINTRTQMRLKV